VNLYLVRHGEATSEAEDPQRALTDRGREEVSRAAALVAQLGCAPTEVSHSGKLRARQTAELLATRMAAPVRQVEGLAPNDQVEPWIALVGEAAHDLMLVGHLPFMERLCASLLTGNPEVGVVRFRQGGVVCLEREGTRWRLLWALWPEMGWGEPIRMFP